MTSQSENLLWLRVAALRGIEIPERDDAERVPDAPRAANLPILGDRFAVRVSRARHNTGEVALANRLASAPSCQGVIGEIVAPAGEAANDGPRRARIPTMRGYALAPFGWHLGLVESEAERLRARGPTERDGPGPRGWSDPRP
jgi:hypothetical protein